MQEAQAHPSLIYHRHPHEQRYVSWEDAVLLTAVLALSRILWPVRKKGKPAHGVERNAGH